MEEEHQQLEVSPEMRRCIESASDCYTICTETLTYSMDVGRDLSDPRHLRLLIDCAEICQTTQNTLLRTSELGQLLTTVCAEACEKVAESCRRLDGTGTDELLVTCAEACMLCAERCHDLSIYRS